jgi:hypothetical protein
MDIFTAYTGHSIFLDIIILLIILFLPVPTTPALIFFVVNNNIYEATIIYLTASTLNSCAIYLIGVFINLLLPFLNNIGHSRIKDSLIKFRNRSLHKIKKIEIDPISFLSKASIYDIGVARMIGMHNHFIMFFIGYFKIQPYRALITNTFFVITDLIFYWIILSSGSATLKIFFPDIDLAELIQSPKFTNFMFVSLILLYLAYFLYRYLRKK